MQTEPVEVLTNREKIIQSLKDYALGEIQRKYGTGNNDGERPLAFHNRTHTMEVIKEVELLAKEAVKNGRGVDVEEIQELGITAAFHDIDQDLKREDRERESARMLQEEMRETGIFSEDQIEKAVNRLIGTTVSWDQYGAMRQWVDPNDYGALLLADADLANLGKTTEIYLEATVKLMKEINGGQIPDIQGQIKFWQSNVRLLSSHEYHTSEAHDLYNNQSANLRKTQDILDELLQKEDRTS